MQLFFSENITNNTIILDEIESKHCIKVLRYKIGDKIYVVDGKGNYYEGTVLSIENKICSIKIKNLIKNFDKKTYYIHIAISPLKNQDRLEWFIEKSVEIGIDEITFINCNRTLRKKNRIDRFLKIAKSAMKQTIKASLPKINPVVSYHDFIKNLTINNKFICHLEHEISNDIFSYKNKISKDEKICILIGPEGDFSLKEVEDAYSKGIKPLSLGKNRFRTETAGIIACHLSNIIMSLDK